MSPARRRLGSVRAVAERLLRGTPRRTPAETLADALSAAVPGVRAASLTLARALPLPAETDPPADDDGAGAEDRPWLEADSPDDAEVLERMTLTLDPGLFDGSETGYTLPGTDLAQALTVLGWSEASGLDGPVRDDVDVISLHAPAADSPADYQGLWAAAVPVAREALLRGVAPGSVVPLPLG